MCKMSGRKEEKRGVTYYITFNGWCEYTRFQQVSDIGIYEMRHSLHNLYLTLGFTTILSNHLNVILMQAHESVKML